MNAILASPLAAQPAALFVGLFIAWLIVRLGRGAFRARLFWVSMSVGAVMGALILFQEAPFQIRANPYHFSALTISFGFAGFPEEAAKMIGAYFLLRPYYLRRTARDMVLAAASLALGFALLENVLYISSAGENWERLALTRALTAVPFHVMLGLCGGYGIARAEAIGGGARGFVRIIGTWIVLSILHGAYDLPQFLMAATPQPEYVAAIAGKLGVAPPTLLFAGVLSSLSAVCLLALFDLWALGRRPFPAFEASRVWAPDTAWTRVLLSRVSGGVFAVVLLIPSIIALAAAVWFGVFFSQPSTSIWLAVNVVCPLTAAAMLLAFPSQPHPKPASPAWRRGVWAVAAVVAALAMTGAYQWGTPAARDAMAAGFVAKGLELAAKGDFDGAIQQYNRALGYDPDFTDALAKRAGAEAAQEHFDLALADLDQAIVLKPDSPDLYYQRSDIHRERHETQAVLADIERALALAPKSPILLAGRAQAYLDARQVAKAREDIIEAERLAPREPAVLRVKAAVFLASHNFEGALGTLNAALEVNPEDPGALFTRGRVLFYRLEMMRAAKDLEHSARLQPTFLYPELWRFLARARSGSDGRVDLAASASKTDEGKWPRPVAKLFLGELNATQARALAANDDQRCEADFYAGSLILAKGDFPGGRALLQMAADECPPEFIEEEGAKAELIRLGAAATTEVKETVLAGGVTSSVLTDDLHVYRGSAKWTFVRTADGARELRADLSFPDTLVEARIVIARKTSSNVNRYQMDIVFSPETIRRWTLSALGEQLGAPFVDSDVGGDNLPIAGAFVRLDEGHFVGLIPAENIESALARLAGNGRITINLSPEKGGRTLLASTLDGRSALAVSAAARAWK